MFFISSIPAHPCFDDTKTAQATPSFLCRLDEEVVYWKTSRLSGKT
jgi:hypothetical protein